MLEGTFFKQTHISSHQRAEIPRFKGEALWVTWMFWMGFCFGSSLVAQMVKCLPAMQKTWVRSLGQEDPLEKEMATHSSTLAWKIPWMEEPDRLQSMGSQRVGHDWTTSLSFYSSFWRGKLQPAPVFLPGESHGRRGLVDYSLWGSKELNTTKQLTHMPS